MAEGRFEELERKRFEVGLTDEEADELGRLIAERQGKPYENAESRVHHDAGPHAWKSVEHDEPKQELPEEPSRERTPHPAAPAAPHFVPAKGGHAPETGEPRPDDLEGGGGRL